MASALVTLQKLLIAKPGLMSKQSFSYSIGDRVAERPKTHGLITCNPAVREQIAQYRKQRYGIVVGFKTKQNSRGDNIKFLRVLWDHLQSPTEHAQCRICPEDTLEEMMHNTMVPGE